MTEKKKKEKVMEGEKTERREEERGGGGAGQRPKQTAAPFKTHIPSLLHVFKLNN